nr:CehA/McbA family metallohydrolase [Myxococcota bacterium]
GSSAPALPSTFGEEQPTPGRLQVALEADGAALLRVGAGSWTVVVSRGYEYELATQDIEIATDGEIVDVTASLARVVETPGVLCADLHIHTRRSNDSADDEDYKLRGALADGLEIPVRSDHEYAADFTASVARLGAEGWANGGVASVEMSSMELWGHMGVLPLTPDPTQINAGAPLWQEYPTPESPDTPLRSMSPVEVFDAARARPERPTVVINHPRGDTNYFGYVGYDPITGTVEREEDWDDEFTAVEFFNDADWRRERGRLVTDWLSFLDRGRRVFAVGSSDSHSMRGSPVGYPRTCLALGVDEPSAVDRFAVRDAVAQGRSTISGGIYVDASIGDVGPGGEVTGGATATVHVRVQAASWVDVDALEIVVDGRTLDTIEILPGDAPDPALRPHVRFERDLEIDVADGTGSYVIVAAYGDATLEPVHPGRIPFGVTNPIFLRR